MEMEQVQLRIKKDGGHGGYVFATIDGGKERCIHYLSSENELKKYLHLDGNVGTLSTRYLHQYSDRGPSIGETNLVIRHGDGWKDYFVVADTNHKS